MKYVGEELLVAFLNWLHEHGYIDSDYYGEDIPQDIVHEFLDDHYISIEKKKK